MTRIRPTEESRRFHVPGCFVVFHMRSIREHVGQSGGKDEARGSGPLNRWGRDHLFARTRRRFVRLHRARAPQTSRTPQTRAAINAPKTFMRSARRRHVRADRCINSMRCLGYGDPARPAAVGGSGDRLRRPPLGRRRNHYRVDHDCTFLAHGSEHDRVDMHNFILRT